MVHNEMIDLDYCRNVGVVLFNFSNEEYAIERGDRIPQMIIERYQSAKFVEVREFTKEKTERGRVILVLQVSDLFQLFLKKSSEKMESTYRDLATFEKKLYQYGTSEELHYKLLNIKS